MFREILTATTGTQFIDDARRYIIDDLLVKGVKGPGKSKQLTSLDMESSMPSDPVPGMIYTFTYDAKEELRGGMRFYDAVPVIFCTGCNKDYVAGINFNFVPAAERAAILDLVYDAEKTFFEDDLARIVNRGGNEFAALPNIATAISSDSGRRAFLKLVDGVCGIPVSKAHRVYARARVARLRLVEYDVWKYIPLLYFNDAVRGARLAEVQASIIKDK